MRCIAEVILRSASHLGPLVWLAERGHPRAQVDAEAQAALGLVLQSDAIGRQDWIDRSCFWWGLLWPRGGRIAATAAAAAAAATAGTATAAVEGSGHAHADPTTSWTSACSDRGGFCGPDSAGSSAGAADDACAATARASVAAAHPTGAANAAFGRGCR